MTDPVLPTRVVALGASAGGVEALEAFFRQAPASAGFAYVVLTHLSPDVESHLAEVLSRCTAMPVRAIRTDSPLLPDCVHVLAPGVSLSPQGGMLRAEPEHRRVPATVIDDFLVALGREYGSRAVGVILSGSGVDGATGLSVLRRAGGLCLVQTPASAGCPSMPEHAMAGGAAHQVLDPSALGQWLGSLVDTGVPPPTLPSEPDPLTLSRVLGILRAKTGRDFSGYKPTTLKRRLRRRMALTGRDSPETYLAALEQGSSEADQLRDDLLINVTGFFRDPGVFDVLRQDILPRFLRLPAIRIWVPACSSGQEAYSVAMLLYGLMEDAGVSIPVRIFATDIDADAVVHARAGIYSSVEMQRVPAAMAERYFVPVPQGFQVRNEIRRLCVFAEQDVLRDPPFSRLDLVCCRNLLIYLEPALQEKVFSTFRFALKPSGWLVLGLAESNAFGGDGFVHHDVRHKIYTKRNDSVMEPVRVPAPPPKGLLAPLLPAVEKPLTELSAQQEAEHYLIAHYSPPAVMLDAWMNITGFFGDIGPFVQPVPGTASFKLVKMVRPELVSVLGALLEAVKSSRVPATHPDLPFEWSGQRGMLQIRAVPLPTAEPSGFLVIFERRVAEPGHATTPEAPLSGGADEAQTRIRELDAQVAFLREELHRLRNEQVCAGEELQAANEEIQSTNEELQSTNEELESAKEELQSTNEELTSINAGMADKLSVLAAENDEVCAMFSAMGIPVVLLSPELRIRRFSQAAAPLLNVIEGDIGRPFSHVRPTLDLPDIERVCGEVLDSRVSHTFESRSASGEWYSVTVRAFPSVPVASVSPGILVMFVGATGVRLSPGDARWFSHVTRDSNEVVTLIDPGGRFMTWSERAERLYGYPESEALRLSINDILPAQYHADMHAMLTAARQRQLCLPERQARKVKSGWVRDVVVRLTAMFDQRGDLYAFALTDTPVERWSESAEKWWGISDILDTVNESLVLMDTKGKILWWGTSAEQMFGFSAAEMLGQSAGKYWQEPLLETLEKYTDVSGTPALFLSFSTTRKTLREGDIATEGFCFPMTRDHQVIFLALWERKR